MSLLTQVVERGMMQHNLMTRISIEVPDKPDALSGIMSMLASLQANVHSISHDRLTTSVPLGHVKIVITFQTLGLEQISAIKKELSRKKVKYRMLN